MEEKVSFLSLLRTRERYVFIEFESDNVAKTVADTVNNYLFSERLLKYQFIAPERAHENLFKNSKKTFWKLYQPAVRRYNRIHSLIQKAKMTKRLLQKKKPLWKRVAEEGLNYIFPGFAAQERSLKRKKVKTSKESEVDISLSSQDPTPVCTPTVLEQWRAAQVDGDVEDNEITLELPPASTKNSVL
ncbi:MKI67 FHA domain-interacting nucleolar phosphoprotein-like [Neopsephotus bourkii]|uniref:MKI67 FHA domain-interacting nucleolar phosphoprotein-like n=1 Tax=Neopsephotus bourkii TaxID=309878 RepID=UPI002AA58792|nr:MKI67 FHA domain-interacting nucleolar phosphoprotein-like [Neopsephotus bourkii]